MRRIFSVELFAPPCQNITFAVEDKYVRRPSKAGAYVFLLPASFTVPLSNLVPRTRLDHALIFITNLKNYINKPVSHRKYHENSTF